MSGRRLVEHDPVPEDYLGNWLSNLEEDPTECENIADKFPTKVTELQHALANKLKELNAPNELWKRFKL